MTKSLNYYTSINLNLLSDIKKYEICQFFWYLVFDYMASRLRERETWESCRWWKVGFAHHVQTPLL